jgi:REP element-mobilizing transposase RayT
MLRGIERRSIFADDVDRSDFVRRLDQLVPELGFRCFAWVLMGNHVHLVLRSGTVRVSRLMARLATGYAGWFNRRHGRAGHLFQNRFRSRRVRDDADLVGLVLYVLRNPLEAGVAASLPALERDPWCGAGALLGRREPYAFEAVGETLALFDPERGRARQQLRAWLEDAAPEAEAPPTPAAPADVTPPRLAPDPHPSLDGLLREVCAELDIDPAELVSRRRERTLAAARARFAVRATRERGASAAEVGRVLGRSRGAVSSLLERHRGQGPGGIATS